MFRGKFSNCLQSRSVLSGLWMRTTLIGLLAATLLILGAGCARDPVIGEVQNLRLTGRADSARALALSALENDAGRLPLWLEFVKTNHQLCRESLDDSDPEIAEYCLQSALICAVMNQRERPPKEWRETGKLVSVEVGNQLNRIMSTMLSQMQTATALKQMRDQQRHMQEQMGVVIRTEQMVRDYRSQARRLLAAGVIWNTLLERLPELHSGVNATYAAEFEKRRQDWAVELELDAAYLVPVQQNARERLNAAIARVQDDVNELGYFLVNSVIENGVLP